MKEKTVALLCPVAETLDPVIFQHTLAMVSFSSQNGVKIKDVGVTKRTLVHSARNALAKGFLQTDNEWAFWMDADMLLPSNTIVKLLETAEKTGGKFVTGIYYQRLGEHFPVLWKKDPETIDGERLFSDPKLRHDGKEAYKHHYVVPSPNAVEPFRADVCGFGCVLMHRSILEKLEYPYFKMITDDCSEDFYFCLQAKKAGVELWADPSLTLGHMSDPVFITKKDFKIQQSELKQVKV